MANNNGDTVHDLLKGLESFLTTKTVVGEPIYLNETIIVPMADVSFGVGAGTFKNTDGKDNSSGGMGGKMSPSAVLVMKDGVSKIINVKNQDTMTKLLDIVPDLVNKFTKSDSGKEPDLDEMLSEE